MPARSFSPATVMSPASKLNAELARRFGAARCAWVAYPEGTKDLNDVLRLKGETAVGEAIRGAKPYPIKGLYKLSDYPDVGEPVTYETGFICLNATSAALARRVHGHHRRAIATARSGLPWSCCARWR